MGKGNGGWYLSRNKYTENSICHMLEETVEQNSSSDSGIKGGNEIIWCKFPLQVYCWQFNPSRSSRFKARIIPCGKGSWWKLIWLTTDRYPHKTWVLLFTMTVDSQECKHVSHFLYFSVCRQYKEDTLKKIDWVIQFQAPKQKMSRALTTHFCF